jgi:uncharacterized membrane protein YozB (DUF420 family)
MERAADRVAWAAIGLLVAIMVTFIGIRLATDVPNVLSGTLPDESSFEHRYAAHAWLAYAHILPGAVYLGIAPIQLWRGFRNRHLPVHRRMGRVAIVAGLVSGIFAILFGLFLSFGGALQATASVLFGAWFVTALVTAYRAIRRRDVATHRRWMIRAFAVGLAVGTIRIWVGLFQALGVLDFRDAFGVAFWISFLLHAAAAEAWLYWRPSASGAVRRARSATAV